MGRHAFWAGDPDIVSNIVVWYAGERNNEIEITGMADTNVTEEMGRRKTQRVVELWCLFWLKLVWTRNMNTLPNDTAR